MKPTHDNADARADFTEARCEPIRPEPPHLVLVDGDELGCVGARLKAARCALGLSLADVYGSTRVPIPLLCAIEDMNRDALPDSAYLRGHLRSVAGAVGLDARHIVDAYLEQRGIDVVRTKATSRRPAVLLTLLVLGSISLTAASGFVLMRSAGVGQESGPTRDGVVAKEIASAPRPVTHTLTLVARRAAHVEIRGADGTVFLSRAMRPGETYPVRRDWMVTMIDGGAFSWRLGERELGAVSEDGARIYALGVEGVLNNAIADTVGGY